MPGVFGEYRDWGCDDLRESTVKEIIENRINTIDERIGQEKIARSTWAGERAIQNKKSNPDQRFIDQLTRNIESANKNMKAFENDKIECEFYAKDACSKDWNSEQLIQHMVSLDGSSSYYLCDGIGKCNLFTGCLEELYSQPNSGSIKCSTERSASENEVILEFLKYKLPKYEFGLSFNFEENDLSFNIPDIGNLGDLVGNEIEMIENNITYCRDVLFDFNNREDEVPQEITDEFDKTPLYVKLTEMSEIISTYNLMEYEEIKVINIDSVSNEIFTSVDLDTIRNRLKELEKIITEKKDQYLVAVKEADEELKTVIKLVNGKLESNELIDDDRITDYFNNLDQLRSKINLYEFNESELQTKSYLNEDDLYDRGKYYVDTYMEAAHSEIENSNNNNFIFSQNTNFYDDFDLRLNLLKNPESKEFRDLSVLVSIISTFSNKLKIQIPVLIAHSNLENSIKTLSNDMGLFYSLARNSMRDRAGMLSSDLGFIYNAWDRNLDFYSSLESKYLQLLSDFEQETNRLKHNQFTFEDMGVFSEKLHSMRLDLQIQELEFEKLKKVIEKQRDVVKQIGTSVVSSDKFNKIEQIVAEEGIEIFFVDYLFSKEARNDLWKDFNLEERKTLISWGKFLSENGVDLFFSGLFNFIGDYSLEIVEEDFNYIKSELDHLSNLNDLEKINSQRGKLLSASIRLESVSDFLTRLKELTNRGNSGINLARELTDYTFSDGDRRISKPESDFDAIAQKDSRLENYLNPIKAYLKSNEVGIAMRNKYSDCQGRESDWDCQRALQQFVIGKVREKGLGFLIELGLKYTGNPEDFIEELENGNVFVGSFKAGKNGLSFKTNLGLNVGISSAGSPYLGTEFQTKINDGDFLRGVLGIEKDSPFISAGIASSIEDETGKTIRRKSFDIEAARDKLNIEWSVETYGEKRDEAFSVGYDIKKKYPYFKYDIKF